MIGLGRMGGNMTIRLERAGHEAMTFEPVVDSTAGSLEELRDRLDPPRAFWMMVPSGKITEETFRTLLGVAESGDTIVDGGNSNFRDSQRRHAEASRQGLHFVDCGTSGGIWGLANGYCLMTGGDDEAVERLHDAFEVEGSRLERIEGYVEDSGEGRWTIAEAIAEDVPVPVISAALVARFASHQEYSFSAKVTAALRNQFGGHAVKEAT
jgi:6-phosphogluconate dehydrogenase